MAEITPPALKQLWAELCISNIYGSILLCAPELFFGCSAGCFTAQELKTVWFPAGC